jgi:hypothetical protein
MMGDNAGILVEPTRWRRRLLVVYSTIVASCLVTVVILAAKDGTPRSVARTGEPAIHRTYDYREIAAVYDSVNVHLTYGEMFHIHGGDSSHIYAETFFDTTWYQGSRDDINANLRWKPFPCDDNTEISIWKAASLCVADTSFTNLNFPDTVSWALRLHDAGNGSLLATLDSTVLFRSLTGHDFPTAHGFRTSDVWEHDTWRIGDVVKGGVDSVFLRAEVNARHGATSYFISDAYTVNRKFSDDSRFSKPDPKKEDQSIVNSLVYTIDVYPNPISSGSQLDVRLKADKDISGRLCLINTLGQVIHTFKAGDFSKAVYSYSYSLDRSLPSGKYWVILASRTNLIIDKTELAIVK